MLLSWENKMTNILFLFTVFFMAYNLVSVISYLRRMIDDVSAKWRVM